MNIVLSRNYDNSGLFGDVTDLIEIVIESRPVLVPRGLELLRCFQFIGCDIEYDRFCWNANCKNCATNIHNPCAGVASRVLACQQLASEGMKIDKLPIGVRLPESAM